LGSGAVVVEMSHRTRGWLHSGATLARASIMVKLGARSITLVRRSSSGRSAPLGQAHPVGRGDTFRFVAFVGGQSRPLPSVCANPSAGDHGYALPRARRAFVVIVAARGRGGPGHEGVGLS